MLTHDTPEVRRLGGRFEGKPAVGANADGRLDVFVKHGAGTVSHRVQNTPSGLPDGNDWTAWENLGSGAKPCVSPGTPGLLAHVPEPEQRRNLAVKGAETTAERSIECRDARWQSARCSGGPGFAS